TSRRWRQARPLLGLAPFVIYLGIFLGVPAVSVVIDAFLGSRGQFTLANIQASFSGIYLTSYGASLELSSISAVIAAIAGLLIAIAISSSQNPTLRRLITTGSGVLANTGGVPLAFAFIAAVGNFGLITGLLSRVGLNPYDHGFSLYTLTGLTVVYLYFLVPLMVLVILPAVDGLQRQWFEASASLGAKRRHFWRYVGLPVLAPAFLAALLVLFVDAFAAYATADAITDGLIPLVPIQIGSLVAGNVLPGEAHLGAALGLGMIVIVALAATIYATVQRRTARWMR
ncbi:MAG: ABC transporter permease subunit, partial [Candidatus Dormiibacterota bacterium]